LKFKASYALLSTVIRYFTENGHFPDAEVLFTLIGRLDNASDAKCDDERRGDGQKREAEEREQVRHDGRAVSSS
jgi:hypothetical protein